MVRYRFFSPFQGLFSQDAFKPIQIMPEFSWRIQALTRLIFNSTSQHHCFGIVDDLMIKMNFCAILILDWATMYLIEGILEKLEKSFARQRLGLGFIRGLLRDRLEPKLIWSADSLT